MISPDSAIGSLELPATPVTPDRPEMPPTPVTNEDLSDEDEEQLQKRDEKLLAELAEAGNPLECRVDVDRVMDANNCPVEEPEENLVAENNSNDDLDVEEEEEEAVSESEVVVEASMKFPIKPLQGEPSEAPAKDLIPSISSPSEEKPADSPSTPPANQRLEVPPFEQASDAEVSPEPKQEEEPAIGEWLHSIGNFFFLLFI